MFGASVQAWQTFYGTIATSASALVGLLFVALSLNAAILIRAESAGLRVLAQQTFSTFVIIIGFSLMFLIPDTTPVGLGLPLFCLAVVGLVSSTRAIGPVLRAKRLWSILRDHVGLKLIGLICMLILAVIIIAAGDAGILYWLVAPMMILLISATLHVWSLLVGIQQAVEQK